MPTTKAGLLRALTELTKEFDRELPLSAALLFAAVARAGDAGIDQGQLQDSLEFSAAAMSRTVQTLSDTHYLKNKPGLGLIERLFDPGDNRRRLLRITPSGEKLIRAVLRALE